MPRSDGIGGARRDVPHLLVMFFAEPGLPSGLGSRPQGTLPGMRRSTSGAGSATADLDGIEPFGFADGISQPQIDWEQATRSDPARRSTTPTSSRWGVPARLSERIRQVHRSAAARSRCRQARVCWPREDVPTKKDLGRNGTYLVMRQLRAGRAGLLAIPARAIGRRCRRRRKSSAAAMVGRTRAGDPLVPAQDEPFPGSVPNRSRFVRINSPLTRIPAARAVLLARTCTARIPAMPISRAARPDLKKLITMLGFGPRGFRDDLDVLGSLSSHPAARPRIRHRNSPEDALTPAPPDEPERGLHFICLNANISRQFEFLQNAWIMNTKFSGLTERERSASRHPRSDHRLPGDRRFHHPRDGRLAAPGVGSAAVRHRPRRRLFLSPEPTRPALLRGGGCLRIARVGYYSKRFL